MRRKPLTVFWCRFSAPISGKCVVSLSVTEVLWQTGEEQCQIYEFAAPVAVAALVTLAAPAPLSTTITSALTTRQSLEITLSRCK